jgi:hypothetical protein
VHGSHIHGSNLTLIGIDFQRNRRASGCCGAAFCVQDNAIRNEVIDNYGHGRSRQSHSLRQVCAGNALIRKADQIHCGMFVKIPNILIDGKPVESGQSFTSELIVGVTSISIIATNANIIKSLNKVKSQGFDLKKYRHDQV